MPGALLVGLVIKSKESPRGDLWVLLGALRQKRVGKQPDSRAQEDKGSEEVTGAEFPESGSKWSITGQLAGSLKFSLHLGLGGTVPERAGGPSVVREQEGKACPQITVLLNPLLESNWVL